MNSFNRLSSLHLPLTCVTHCSEGLHDPSFEGDFADFNAVSSCLLCSFFACVALRHNSKRMLLQSVTQRFRTLVVAATCVALHAPSRNSAEQRHCINRIHISYALEHIASYSLQSVQSTRAAKALQSSSGTTAFSAYPARSF